MSADGPPARQAGLPDELASGCQRCHGPDGRWQSRLADQSAAADGERPFAVLAWSKGVEQRYPLIAVPLDRSDLTNFNGDEIDYVYRRALHSLDS